mgnify:CR=1 FL=1
MSNHAARLLTECLIASGADPEQAARAVAVVLPAAVACELIPQAHLDAWELGARIYQLRVGLSIREVALRLGVGPRWVIVVTGRHGKRVRAARKVSAA